MASIPVKEFAAKTVKQAICGQGQASKTQMQNMVIRILGLAKIREDAADALGIALCAGYSKDGVGAVPDSDCQPALVRAGADV